jgi:hypothetical protein
LAESSKKFNKKGGKFNPFSFGRKGFGAMGSKNISTSALSSTIKSSTLAKEPVVEKTSKKKGTTTSK